MVTDSSNGVRSRRHYATTALAALAAAAVLTSAALIAVIDEDASLIGLTVSLASSAVLLAIATTTGLAAARWPEVPTLVHRIAPNHPNPMSSLWATVRPTGKVVVVTILALVGIGTLVAIFAESWLLAIDEPIYYDWLDAAEDKDRYGPSQFNWMGHLLPAAVAGLVVGLVAFRCRLVSIAYLSVLTIGWFTNVGLSWVSHRLRPARGAHEGAFTSYPGGHSLQVALVLLMLPLVVAAITTNRLARNLTALAAISVWAVAWTDIIRTGGHWPLDQLAGLGLAGVFLILVYSAAADPLRHQKCNSCGLVRAHDQTPRSPSQPEQLDSALR